MSVSPDSSPSAASLPLLRGRTLETLAVGDSARIVRQLTREDLQVLAALFAGVDASHDGPALEAAFLDIFGRGLWGSALVAGLLGTELPGPGLGCERLDLRFLAPLALNDTLAVTATVTAVDAASGQATLAIVALRGDGQRVFEGDAVVLAPRTPITLARGALPDLGLAQGEGTMAAPWIAKVRTLGAIRMAVVHPCSSEALKAAIEAAQAGLIEPLLVAPRAKLEALAADAGLDLAGWRIEDVPHSHAAAARIKGIVSPVAGQADILLVPDLESGNMLAKQLEYMGNAATAGVVLGARVPIVLTSRADAADTRIASCAIAVLLAHRNRRPAA